MKRRTLEDRHCALARSVAQLIDAWTFVILRELFFGNRRFEGLRLHTGMSPRSLSLRLGHLVEQGILERRVAAAPPAHPEYRLTPKGLDLWPVLVTLRQWGDRWAGPWGEEGPPLKLVHRGRGHALAVQLHCVECSESVDAHSVEVEATAEALRERAAFAAAQKPRKPRPPGR